MDNRNAAWLTPATSRSCAAALMTTGWEPTDSMSSTTFGSWRVMIQGAPLKMAGSAASIPDASLPHMGWPPTRSTPDADAQFMTVALVLAMSVTTLAAVLPASRLNTSRMARTGAAITTTSAMSTMLRSEWATSTIRRSTAFLTTAGSRSLPTIVCPLSCSASANDEPMRPRPTTATVGTTTLSELFGHRAEQAPEVGHQPVESREIERLGAVRQRLIGRGMHLDDQAVRAPGHRGERHRTDQGVAASRLRRIDDHGQVRELAHERHRVEVQREPSRGLERADAALAKDHAAVALRQHVLGGEQPLLDGRRHAALEQHGLARAPGLLQQRVVLHVARAELKDVRVPRDHLHVVRRDDLGDDFQARLVARGGHHLQAGLAQALERVRRRARLECAAAQHLRSLGRDVARGLEQHLLALDRARSGHDHDLFGPDLHAAHIDDRVLGAELATCELERLGDRDDLVDAAEVREGLAVGVGVGADDADQRSLLATGELGLQADLMHAVDHRVDLAIGGGVPHHDDHEIDALHESRSALIAFAPRRSTNRISDCARSVL